MNLMNLMNLMSRRPVRPAPASARRLALALGGALGLSLPTAQADLVGSVATNLKWMGPSDKIVVEVFQDPDIPGVACYLSRAKTGGLSGAVGLAEDSEHASLACRQTGPIELPERVANGKDNGTDVFKKRTSLLTKTMQVVRFYDPPRNTLVYLNYSDRIIEGAPHNAISVVVIRPWHTATPAAPGTPVAAPGPAGTPGE